ncbi:hypothetical protein CR513_18857, partial [Mucuna pruriens]
MDNNDRTLKELSTPDINLGVFDILNRNKLDHMSLSEDPHKHLQKFHVVCSTMRPHGIPKDYIKMKAFLFPWMELPRTAYLEKFFPTSRTTSISNEICGIRQHIGLMLMDRSMICAASGGALMDKTPIVARNLISNMVGNTQQFGVRGSTASKVVNEVVVVDNQRLENKITNLTSLVRQLAIGQHHISLPIRVCGIYASVKHPIDVCPTLQETEPNSAKVTAMMDAYKALGEQRWAKLATFTQLLPSIIIKHKLPKARHEPSHGRLITFLNLGPHQVHFHLLVTLKELAILDIMYQPWCIRYLEWEQVQSSELKSGLTYLLPMFHGLVGSTQQFGVTESATPSVVNEVVVVGNQRLKNKITEVISLVKQLAIEQHHISAPTRNIQLMSVPFYKKLNRTVLNIGSPMISTQTGDMVCTLRNMYLNDTNHHLPSNNNMFSKIIVHLPYRIW